MISMDQGWAVIIAAAAAGFFGIAGAFAGFVFARHQPIDQAAVEHDLWLRGQRQTAYIDAFNAIDAAVTELENLRKEWDERFERSMMDGGAESFGPYVRQLLIHSRKIAGNPAERAVLLGPFSLCDALQHFETAYMAMDGYLARQAEDPARERDWTEWDPVWRGVLKAREALFHTAQSVLWEPPGLARGGSVAFRRRRR
ncbi:hypothetical protein [Streptomyces chartreusis]|uniref:DUF4760 domain-containing protein n=1 Tax=Streptomyces chartreusis TaxID=1969 RepID=A0A7H8T742_STRCX|nr:hypothetical protein [Streptomyces chartreusis]QKZ18842.1 hypothetical protein HUT05_16615 [Streptomyces chartreusis]